MIKTFSLFVKPFGVQRAFFREKENLQAEGLRDFQFEDQVIAGEIVGVFLAHET